MPSRCAIVAVAGWLALGGASLAGDEATGRPTPIGHVSREVSPAGFVYTEAPGVPTVPPELRKRHRPILNHKPAPKRFAPAARTG